MSKNWQHDPFFWAPERQLGGGWICYKDSPSAPPPPDYTPLATSSTEAAQLGKQLGEAQLAESKRQYDNNMLVAAPVVQAQLGLMNQTREQGDDYFNYMKANQRPVEGALNAQSMAPDLAGQEAARRGIMDVNDQTYARNEMDRGLLTGGDTDVYNARQGDIEQSAGRAAADARMGSTAMMNQLIRQGQRYGYSANAMAARFAPGAMQAGLGQASAMNSARQAGIDRARGLLGQDYALRNENANQRMAALSANRSMGIQDQSQNWGRMMDVAGLYRNLPGASQGAYGLSLGAGNAALGNQMQPGGSYLTGMAQGAGMQQTGMGQQLQGQAGVLNAQGQYANTAVQSNQQGGGLMGSLLGAGSQLGSAWLMAPSDRRLKEDVVLVGRTKHNLNLYEFAYKGRPDARYRGVMADEVLKVMPEAVDYTNQGYARVDYHKLGIAMEEV